MFEHFKNQSIRGYNVKADGKYVQMTDSVTTITYDNYMSLPNHALYAVMGIDNPMDKDFIHFQNNFGSDADEPVAYATEEIRVETERVLADHKTLMEDNYFADIFGANEFVMYRDDEFMYRVVLGKNRGEADYRGYFRQFVSLCGGGLDPADAYQMMMM